MRSFQYVREPRWAISFEVLIPQHHGNNFLAVEQACLFPGREGGVGETGACVCLATIKNDNRFSAKNVRTVGAFDQIFAKRFAFCCRTDKV